jgi:NAD dependent epimerase/dehydratase family enzyme
MPWIALDDWVGIARLAIEDARASGPFNVSAPEPVTNAEFTKTLGRVLGRPTIFPVPAFALKLAFGELADALLTGQRAVPEKALQLGHRFKHTALADALHAAID